jgi:hypothetical protein
LSHIQPTNAALSRTLICGLTQICLRFCHRVLIIYKNFDGGDGLLVPSRWDLSKECWNGVAKVVTSGGSGDMFFGRLPGADSFGLGDWNADCLGQ